MQSKIKNTIVKCLPMAMLLTLASTKLWATADSVLLYTLKENERIVMISEHRLLVTNTNIGHLLFLSRPNGFYIRYNAQEYGPYESISLTEAQQSLTDWAVKQKGKWYQLLLDKGLMVGPYDQVVDLYRSKEYADFYKGTDYSGNHYGFRAQRNGQWYTNINGKEHGPYAKEPEMGIPNFSHHHGMIVASLVAYQYSWKTEFSKSDGDSVVVAKLPNSQYRLLEKVLYKNGEKVKEQIRYFAEDISRKNLLTIDTADQVFLNDHLLADCPGAYRSSYGNYDFNRPDFIFNSGQAVIKLQKNETDYEHYYYLTRQKKTIGPIKEVDYYLPLWFTRNADHYAFSRGTTILIDDRVVHKRGFSLVHNPALDCFSWLTVKNRSIYLHSYRP